MTEKLHKNDDFAATDRFHEVKTPMTKEKWEDFLAWKSRFEKTQGNGYKSNSAASKDRSTPYKDSGSGSTEPEEPVGGLHPREATDPDTSPTGTDNIPGHDPSRDSARPVLGIQRKGAKKRRTARKRAGYSNHNPVSG